MSSATWTIEVETPFKDCYQRANKAGAQKNMRCFPACQEDGHRRSNFCGRPVMCFVSSTSRAELETVQVYAQFCVRGVVKSIKRKGDPPSGAGGGGGPGGGGQAGFAAAAGGDNTGSATFDINSHANEELLATLSRSREAPLKPLIVGTRIHLGRVMARPSNKFAINRECMAWHYGFRSHKSLQNSDHVLRIYIFARPGGRQDLPLMCVAIQDSPGFKIASQRRTSTKAKAGAAKGRGGGCRRCR